MHVRMQRVDEHGDAPQRNAAVDHPLAQFRQHVFATASRTARRRSASRQRSDVAHRRSSLAAVSSGFMPRAHLITLAHFAMSSAMNFAELGGRHRRQRRGAEIGQPLLDRGVAQRRVDLLVERRDDFRRRALRRADADPGDSPRSPSRNRRSVGTSGRAARRSTVDTPSARVARP